MSSSLILIIVLVILVGYAVSAYNSLVKGKLNCEEAWAGIDVQLKRRYDMIPNLVEIVKGYATHEKGVLESVTNARNMAMSASGAHNKAEAENALTGALKSLFALSESYPDLKANTNFLKLQEEYAVVEDAIQGSRRLYNSAVKGYNSSIQMFPSNIFANIFSFKESEFFEVSDAKEKENIKIEM